MRILLRVLAFGVACAVLFMVPLNYSTSLGATGEAMEVINGVLFALIFLAYAVFGNLGYRRLISFVGWPLSFAGSAWCGYQLYQALSIHSIAELSGRSNYEFSSQPNMFGLLLFAHSILFVTCTGVIVMRIRSVIRNRSKLHAAQ